MKFRANKMLGLAVGERSILVAEVTVDGESLQVSRAGEFSYGEGISLSKPAELGATLQQFLKQQGFVARTAVVGIPAKWVLTKSKEMPPVAAALAADMLRIQVEHEFSSELKDLVYDYAGESSPTNPAQVLLAASPKKYVEQMEAIAEAARIDLHAITPTTVVLGVATTPESGDAMVLSITRSGTELMARRAGNPTLLRHVGSGSTLNAAIAGEVRRASLQISSQNGQPGNGSSNGRPSGSIVVWDDLDADPAARASATAALGSSARAGRWADLLTGGAPSEGGSAAAVALAVAGVLPTGLPIDFLHSRLAPPKQSAVKRQTILAIVAAFMVLIGIIYAIVDLHGQESELAVQKNQLTELQRNEPAAEDEVKMIRQAQGWHADKPRYLQCIRDITQAFPDSGNIFVTGLNLHKGMDGSITGKAGTQQSVLLLDNHLKSSKHFNDVKTSFENRDDRSGTAVTFTITFTFIPHD